MNLPLYVLLVMYNVPAYPPGLHDLHEEFKFIKIHFLPLDTILLFHFIEQQVIFNITKFYIKTLFQCCFMVTEGTISFL